MPLSCQLCKNNLFNTIKSLSFILAGCSLKTVKCKKKNIIKNKIKNKIIIKSQFFTVENEEDVERTQYLSDVFSKLLLCIKASEHFPFSSSVTCLPAVMTHFYLTIFQSVLLPRLCRLSLPTMPCVCSPLPAFGWLELDHQSFIAHSHLQKNKKNKRTFPSTKSCILIRQSWCTGTSQTRWLSFPPLQKEFEEKVWNCLTELSTSWEVGLTSTCYYIWHLDVNAAHGHTHTHTRAVWAFWCISNI